MLGEGVGVSVGVGVDVYCIHAKSTPTSSPSPTRDSFSQIHQGKLMNRLFQFDNSTVSDLAFSLHERNRCDLIDKRTLMRSIYINNFNILEQSVTGKSYCATKRYEIVTTGI
jgi:hypothetical protein